MTQVAVILAAAGGSSRFGHAHYKKPFAPLDGRAVWLHSAERFLHRDDVRQVILAIAPEDEEEFQRRFSSNVVILGIEVVLGGATRCETIERALARVRPEIDLVAVHDAARPCLADEWISQVIAAAERDGAAILAIPVAGTLKRVQGQRIEQTVARENLWEAQTPQVFRRQLLLDAYAQRGDCAATDDAQLVERQGRPVAVVRGSPINLKITTQEDLRLAEQALRALPKPKNLGPVHPFADDDLWR